MIRAEWVKVKRSSIWLVAAVMPILSVVLAVRVIGLDPAPEPVTWDVLTSHILPIHRDMIFPVTMAIVIAMMWRMETVGANWVLVRTNTANLFWFALAKTVVMILFALYSQGFVLIATMGAGTFYYGLPGVFSLAFLSTLGWCVVFALPIIFTQSALSIGIRSPITPVIMALAGCFLSYWIIPESSLYIVSLLLPYSLFIQSLPYPETIDQFIPILDQSDWIWIVGSNVVMTIIAFILMMLCLHWTRR